MPYAGNGMEQGLALVGLSILVIHTRDAALNAFWVQTVQRTEPASTTNAVIHVLEPVDLMHSAMWSTTFLHAAACLVTQATLCDLALLFLQLVRTSSNLSIFHTFLSIVNSWYSVHVLLLLSLILYYCTSSLKLSLLEYVVNSHKVFRKLRLEHQYMNCFRIHSVFMNFLEV